MQENNLSNRLFPSYNSCETNKVHKIFSSYVLSHYTQTDPVYKDFIPMLVCQEVLTTIHQIDLNIIAPTQNVKLIKDVFFNDPYTASKKITNIAFLITQLSEVIETYTLEVSPNILGIPKVFSYNPFWVYLTTVNIGEPDNKYELFLKNISYLMKTPTTIPIVGYKVLIPWKGYLHNVLRENNFSMSIDNPETLCKIICSGYITTLALLYAKYRHINNNTHILKYIKNVINILNP